MKVTSSNLLNGASSILKEHLNPNPWFIRYRSESVIRFSLDFDCNFICENHYRKSNENRMTDSGDTWILISMKYDTSRCLVYRIQNCNTFLSTLTGSSGFKTTHELPWRLVLWRRSCDIKWYSLFKEASVVSFFMVRSTLQRGGLIWGTWTRPPVEESYFYLLELELNRQVPLIQ